MVKVLRSFVRGPLEPHAAGFAKELLRQGYSRSSAEQHVCFIAHLNRWMAAAGVGLHDLTGSVIGRYLAQRRAAGMRSTAQRKRCSRCWTTSRRSACYRSRSRCQSDRRRSCWATTANTFSPSVA